MRTKVLAAAIAAKAGCRTLLAHGRAQRVLERLLAGEELGTLFLAQKKLANRTRWILNSAPQGRLAMDEREVAALRKGKSRRGSARFTASSQRGT